MVTVGDRAGTLVLQHTAGAVGGAGIARRENGSHTLTLRYELGSAATR